MRLIYIAGIGAELIESITYEVTRSKWGKSSGSLRNLAFPTQVVVNNIKILR